MTAEKWKKCIWNIKYVVKISIATKLLLLFKAYLVGKYFLSHKYILEYELAFSEIGIFSFLASNGLMLAVIWHSMYVKESATGEELNNFTNDLVNMVLLMNLFPIIILGVLLLLNLIKLENLVLRNFFLIGLPIVLFTSIKVIYTGYLQMKHGFFAGNRGNLARALIYVIILLVFKEALGLKNLMLLGLGTSLVQLFIAYQGMWKHGYSYSFKIKPSREVEKTIGHGILIMILNTIYEYSLFWRQSNFITIFVIGIGLTAITTVIYPILAEDYIRYKLGKSQDFLEFNYDFSRALGLYFNFIIPFMIIMFFQSKNIKILLDFKIDTGINLLFHSGAGIVAISTLPFILRTLIALEKYRESFISMGIASLVGFALIYLKRDGRLDFDLALFLSGLLGLYFINRETDFLGSPEFKYRTRLMLRPVIGVFLVNVGIYFIYLKIRIDFMSQELFYFLLASVVSLVVFLYGYFRQIKNRK